MLTIKLNPSLRVKNPSFLHAATPASVSEHKEQSPVVNKALLVTDPVMKPEVDFNNASTGQHRTAGCEISRASSPVRATRELYCDVFKAGSGEAIQAVKPLKNSFPSFA